MTCGRQLDAFSALLDDELPDREVDELATHLEGCLSCRATSERLRTQHARLVALDPAPGPDLATMVLSRAMPASAPALGTGKPARSDRRAVVPRWLVAAAAGLLPLLGLGLWTAAQQGSPGAPLLAIGEGRASVAPKGGASVLSLDVTNRGGGDRVVDASSAAADRVELHLLRTQAGLPVMQAVTSVAVPPNATESFGTGGTHLMLTGLHDELRAGETITVTLRFARAGNVAVQAVIEPP